jgi:serine/threonine-protein kinase
MTQPTSSVVPEAEQAELPESNARYRVERLLGQGGMALVYEASERTSARKVALKRLTTLPDPRKQARNMELFEREYHTLSQLEHPRIVSVLDFGIDERGAYYAMELLEGGDLQELAPLPWRRACAIARDVCSALSLLHSRRFVHRDVSPRNVRCLKDGPAKLIDFGAMAPTGPTKLLVGTPPCCAPESVQLQSIDGRTDLFALGATLYYVLVGQHAYPARYFASLNAAWRAGFPRPSEVVPEIPPELDALVLDLLRLEPDARPASAAEVMERLSAIDGEHATEQLVAANAYLATPTLVGREALLARVRRRVQRATGGRSRSVVIEGAAGVGRTRFLDACLLEATLVGQVVVRADSDDAISGDYGVLRAVARQLLERVPQTARETAAPLLDRLGSLVPELANEATPANDVIVPRAHMQRALHEWLTSLSKRCPFVLAIDDFHAIDEPSAALIALLERDSTEQELCLLIAVESGATWTAESSRKLLSQLTTLKLEPLSEEDSVKLLSSVFGTVPNVEVLAHRARELCAGSPRDLLRLAQHLVDRGVVRYAAGAWSLPSAIDASDLPASLSDALAARLTHLPEAALELACAFALCPDQSFGFEECSQLSATSDPATRVALLEALVRADIVRRVGDDVKLSQPAWTALVRASISCERTQRLERRLAELLERRGGEEFRAAQHWFRSGEIGRALDMLVMHAEHSQEATARGPEIFLRYFMTLPEDWFATFREGMRGCDALQRPGKDKYQILSRLAGIMAILNMHSADVFTELLTFLRRDSGYDDYHALDPSMEPGQRLMAALTRTQERYNATPDNERVLDPISAIRNLARALVAATGPISMTLDVELLHSLPKITPFLPLSPALVGTHMLIEGLDARCTGRFQHARRTYIELLERVSAPDRSGFDPSHAEYMTHGVNNGLGLIEAGLGMPTCTERADKLENHPAYEVNAQIIRMLDCYLKGDVSGAELHKRTADRLRIQNSGRQMYEGGHLLWEVQAHAMSGDLTRVRQAAEEIAPFAKRYSQWLPVLRYATAEHCRMTRDFERARTELELVLSGMPAGTHQIWSQVANSHVLVLLELGQSEAALEKGRAYVESAERELGEVSYPLQLSLATARVACGDAGGADAIDAVIQRMQEQQLSALYVGVAHELRARSALRLSDSAGFARHAEACRLIFLAHKGSALTAKYHRLVQDGRRAMAPVERSTVTPDSSAHYGRTRIDLALAGCRDDEQRARLALTLLTRQSGAIAGLLFLINDNDPECAAQVGSVPDPGSLMPQLLDYLDAQAGSGDVTVTGSDDDEGSAGSAWTDVDGRVWKPLLVSHFDGATLAITGVAVLEMPSDSPIELSQAAQTASAISQYFAGKGATSMLILAD